MSMMFAVGVEGLIIDQFAQVLLIQREDSRTWALPGGGLEANELPTDGMAREVFEETGYKVYPVRLVQLSYMRGRKFPLLIFLFRGLLKGGSPQTSAESLQVGFVKTERLPRMIRAHRERLRAGQNHAGGAPLFVEQRPHSWAIQLLRRLIYRWKDFKRYRQGVARYQPPGLWYVEHVVVIPDGQGKVLWVQGESGWQLPGGICEVGQPPWIAAAIQAQAQCGAPVKITDLISVTVTPENRMTLCFMGQVMGNAAAGHWATFEEIEASGGTIQNKTYVQDALTDHEVTKFHAFTTKR